MRRVRYEPARQRGPARQASRVVFVAPSAAPSTAIKTWLGLADASTKTVIGVARAQVKTFIGLN